MPAASAAFVSQAWGVNGKEVTMSMGASSLNLVLLAGGVAERGELLGAASGAGFGLAARSASFVAVSFRALTLARLLCALLRTPVKPVPSFLGTEAPLPGLRDAPETDLALGGGRAAGDGDGRPRVPRSGDAAPSP